VTLPPVLRAGAARLVPAVLAAVALAAAATFAVAAPAAAAPAGGVIVPCAASDEARVAVVVAFPSGVVSRCAAPGGSGIDVLRRAGFDPVTYGFAGQGAAVCAVTHPGTGEQMGCASGPSCLTCAGRDYWGYFRGNARGYSYHPRGGGGTVPTTSTVPSR